MTAFVEGTPKPVLQFIPPKADLREILTRAASENHVLEPQGLDREFRRLFAQVQEANGQWAESRLRTLRAGTHDWSLDGMLVNKEGRIALGPWSTYGMYLANKVPDLTLITLLSEMQRLEELLFPITPQRDSANFWLEEHEEQIIAAFQEHLPTSLEVEYYGDYSSTNFGFRRMADLRRIKMGKIVSGKVGDGKLAQRDVVRGRVGFWENSTPEGPTYTPRVYIEKSRIFPKQTYISSLSESAVLVKGGIPINERYSNLHVLRIEPHLVEQNFIIAALITFSNAYKGTPFVLRFDTYKPWVGLYPHHG